MNQYYDIFTVCSRQKIDIFRLEKNFQFSLEKLFKCNLKFINFVIYGKLHDN